MTETAQEILQRARDREETRATYARPPIDYDAANKMFPKQKAALTRAINSGDRDKVVLACAKTVKEWNAAPFNGAWPDDWSRWQRALDDAFGWPNQAPRLQDLE